jgi:hypothetical protein
MLSALNPFIESLIARREYIGVVYNFYLNWACCKNVDVAKKVYVSGYYLVK